MNRPFNIFRAIYSLYAIILFIAIMLLIFPFVILVNLPVAFAGKNNDHARIRAGNNILRICGIWADIWFPLIFIRFKKIYEVPHDPSRLYIFVNNHISYLDSAILPVAYRQPVRPLGKVEMARIPIFGFIYRNAIVTVDRSSPENRARSILRLQSNLRKGVSVLVFPEGTFNTTGRPLKDFYDGAFRLAIETQTPVKPVLFLDSFSRMHYAGLFDMTPGINRIVYLPEVSVGGLTIADVPALRQTVYDLMEKRLIEYKASWIHPMP